MSVVLMEGKMNTKKNERFAETDRRIRKAFTKMVLNKKTNQISGGKFVRRRASTAHRFTCTMRTYPR